MNRFLFICAAALLAAALPALAQVARTPRGAFVTAVGWRAGTATTSTATVTWVCWDVVTIMDVDGGYRGPADSQELRYSEALDDEFDARIAVPDPVPPPAAEGEKQSATVTRLEASRTYFFVMRTRFQDTFVDSDPLKVLTLDDPGPPQGVTDLRAAQATEAEAALTWTAVADDDPAETVRSYEVRRSTEGPILRQEDFDAAEKVFFLRFPAEPGAPESLSVPGLEIGVEYHFSVQAVDEGGHAGKLSNCPSLTLVARESSGSGSRPCGASAAGGVLVFVLLAGALLRRQ